LNQFKRIQGKLATFRANSLKSVPRSGTSKLKILVVDNEKLNQLFLVNQLKKFNISSDIANNGLEAIAMMAEMNYDVVFMDLEMPVMDGLEATQKIRAIHGENPFIVGYTSHQEDYYHTQCLEAGMNYMIPKKAYHSDLDLLFKNIYKTNLNE